MIVKNFFEKGIIYQDKKIESVWNSETENITAKEFNPDH